MSVPIATCTVAGSPSRHAAASRLSVEVAGARTARREVAPHRGAEAEAVAVALDDRPVHLLAGLAGHAEGARAEPRLDVLRGLPGHRELEVVDDPRPVEGDRGDEAPLHEVDQDRREADLDHVGAQPPDDGPAAGAGPQDLVAQRAQRLAGEDPRAGESRKRARPSPRRCGPAELRAGDLALPRREGVGRDAGRGRAAGAHQRRRRLLDDLAQDVEHHRVHLLDALGVAVRHVDRGGGRGRRARRRRCRSGRP